MMCTTNELVKDVGQLGSTHTATESYDKKLGQYVEHSYENGKVKTVKPAYQTHHPISVGK